MSLGIDAGRQLRRAERDIKEMQHTVTELKDDTHTAMSAIVSSLRYTSESMRTTLVGIPWDLFQPEWVWTPNRRFEAGEVARMGENKWISLNNNVDIPQGQTPETSPNFLLHRDKASFNLDGTKRNHVREEFCLQGFWRWDESSNQVSQRGWYEVIVPIFSGSQSPFQVPQYWAFRGNQKPPDATQ